jgi:hypothetical protein
VDDDGVDLDRFKKNNVSRDAIADFGVRRVHEAAAVFDDERRAAEFLDIRQRFKQRSGFGDQILHAVFLARSPAKESAIRDGDFTLTHAAVSLNCRHV